MKIDWEEAGRIALIVFVMSAALVFAMMCHGAEIVGPEVVEAGTLAVFTCEDGGDCVVIPGNAYAKDSGGKALYFASRTGGEYTVIWCTIAEGEPKIATFTFVNEANSTPPGPPAPVVKPAPAPVVTPDFNLTKEEKSTVIWAMESVITHIDQGAIRTPQGARATFKKAVERRIPNVSPALNSQLGVWTLTVDFSTVQTIRADFAKIVEELK